MSLQEEIRKKSESIHTSGYPMSIGELISLYRDYELDIHPEFQRFFRWDDYQKSRLIESILIGIPIPSIFVYQREDGIWDVIDGVQRLSTVFQFVGILEGENKEKIEPLCLKGTKYLPSLEGKIWQNEDEDQSDNSFTMAQRIEFKRTQFDIKIIKEDDDQDARYELFKRINLGGTSLSKQEVRNFLLVMINRKFYEFLQAMASEDFFQICIRIHEDKFSEQYDLELVSRFLVLKNSQPDEIQNAASLSVFITDKMAEFANFASFEQNAERGAGDKNRPKKIS